MSSTFRHKQQSKDCRENIQLAFVSLELLYDV